MFSGAKAIIDIARSEICTIMPAFCMYPFDPLLSHVIPFFTIFAGLPAITKPRQFFLLCVYGGGILRTDDSSPSDNAIIGNKRIFQYSRIVADPHVIAYF